MMKSCTFLLWMSRILGLRACMLKARIVHNIIYIIVENKCSSKREYNDNITQLGT